MSQLSVDRDVLSYRTGRNEKIEASLNLAALNYVIFLPDTPIENMPLKERISQRTCKLLFAYCI